MRRCSSNPAWRLSQKNARCSTSQRFDRSARRTRTSPAARRSRPRAPPGPESNERRGPFVSAGSGEGKGAYWLGSRPCHRRPAGPGIFAWTPGTALRTGFQRSRRSVCSAQYAAQAQLPGSPMRMGFAVADSFWPFVGPVSTRTSRPGKPICDETLEWRARPLRGSLQFQNRRRIETMNLRPAVEPGILPGGQEGSTHQ